MDKQKLKARLLEAVKKNPHRDDIKSIALFGSHVHGTAKEDSDVDVLIEFMPNATVGFFKLAQIQRSLRDFLGRKVDLLTPEAISKYFRNEVLQEAERVYET
jgi:predicted nucleotidyltransferase